MWRSVRELQLVNLTMLALQQHVRACLRPGPQALLRLSGGASMRSTYHNIHQKHHRCCSIVLTQQQHQQHQVRFFGSKRRKNRRRDAHKYRGAANADFVEDSDGYDDVFGFKPSSRSERRRGQQRSRRQRALETPLDWAFVDGRKARHKMQQLEQLHGRRRGRAAPRRSGGLRALQHKRREKLMKVLADLPNALSLRDMVAEFAPLTDMSQPHQWYPAARAIKRRIVLHVGPTNSGKTHAALQRLAAAGQLPLPQARTRSTVVVSFCFSPSRCHNGV